MMISDQYNQVWLIMCFSFTIFIPIIIKLLLQGLLVTSQEMM